MTLSSLKLLVALVALFTFGHATNVAAQAVTDSPQRVELKRTDLTGAPGMEVVESTAEYKKGDRINAHVHHGVEAGYVLQGTMIQIDGREPSMMATGTPIFNLRDARHGGYTIVGDTPLMLFTVHIVDKGAPLYDYGK